MYLDKEIIVTNINTLITNFENYIIAFKTPDQKELSPARKLIRNDFKEFIDQKFNIKK